MPISYASHTPAHIATLLEAIIGRMDTQQLPETPFVLCTSLPESIEAGTHYIVLGDAPAGADARISAIATPLSLAQLVAHVTAASQTPSAIIMLGGGWQFSASARLLEHAAQAPVALTELEAALLAHLAQGAGNDMSRDTLMRDIWRYDEATQTHTLETHMYRLRGKLEKLEPSACQITTTDAGYRLELA